MDGSSQDVMLEVMEKSLPSHSQIRMSIIKGTDQLSLPRDREANENDQGRSDVQRVDLMTQVEDGLTASTELTPRRRLHCIQSLPDL